jgi:NAD(P)-dependent dehydrogenase (short-subunit alcohol dehydrogenase family)
VGDDGLLSSAIDVWGGTVSRILITGSTDGLGLMTGRLLAEQGHSVTLHARDDARAAAARTAEAVVVGDGSSIAETCRVAEQANAGGRFDAVVHNVGVGYREPRRIVTTDGLSTCSRSTCWRPTC